MRDFIAEVNRRPLDQTLFVELFHIATEALQGRRREIPPDAERCLEDMPSGTMYLTDIPMNQMGMAIVAECRRRFPKDAAQHVSQSFMFRSWALEKAVTTGRVSEFARETEGHLEVNGAVFSASAQCPLDADGDFDKSYEARIRQFSAESDD